MIIKSINIMIFKIIKEFNLIIFFKALNPFRVGFSPSNIKILFSYIYLQKNNKYIEYKI